MGSTVEGARYYLLSSSHANVIAHTELVIVLSVVGTEFRDSLVWNSQRGMVLEKAAADGNNSARVLCPGGRAVGLTVL